MADHEVDYSVPHSRTRRHKHKRKEKKHSRERGVQNASYDGNEEYTSPSNIEFVKQHSIQSVKPLSKVFMLIFMKAIAMS